MRRGVFRALWRRESWLVHIFILIYYMGPCTRSTLLTSLLILNVCIKDLLHVLYLESNVAVVSGEIANAILESGSIRPMDKVHVCNRQR
jgi:hypothetical protein